MQSKEFEFDDKEYMVKTPTTRQQQEAKRIYLRVWNESRKDSVLRPNLEQFLLENGLWTQEQQAEVTSLEQRIGEIEDFLEAGDCDKNTGTEKAIECQQLRLERIALLSEKGSYDGITAEAQAENAQFDFLVSQCLVYNNNEKTKVFSSYDEFLDSDQTELISMASNLLSELIHGVSWNTLLTDTPEYRFLEEQAAAEEKEEAAAKRKKRRTSKKAEAATTATTTEAEVTKSS
jgi:hypothetical protein